LKRGGDNHSDEFSPFRGHLKNIRMHCKKSSKENTLTLQELKAQWERQAGICVYTGWPMKNPQSTSHILPHTIDRASVDRIDSSKGYTKDNIQFVCVIAQYAKHSFSENELLSFCRAVVQNYPQT
jgi:hypothetical protein